MKTYLITAGVVFSLITVIHIWRILAEGPHLLHDPFFMTITVIVAGLSVWAWCLVIRSQP